MNLRSVRIIYAQRNNSMSMPREIDSSIAARRMEHEKAQLQTGLDQERPRGRPSSYRALSKRPVDIQSYPSLSFS